MNHITNHAKKVKTASSSLCNTGASFDLDARKLTVSRVCNDPALQTLEGCLQAHNSSPSLLLHGKGREGNTHLFLLHLSCPHSQYPL